MLRYQHQHTALSLSLSLIFLSACSAPPPLLKPDQTASDTTSKFNKQLVFSELAVPESELEKQSVLTSPTAMVNGKKYEIGYHTLFKSGDSLNGQQFGQLLDYKGQPILDKNGQPKISNRNDYTSLLAIEDKLFMTAQFEDRPGAFYQAELAQDAQGILKPTTLKALDMSAVNGGWVHCAGSITPWNSHLGSEEYEPDVTQWHPLTGELNESYASMADYFAGDLKQLNPYDYGWVLEAKILDRSGQTDLNKHYSMGRLSHELAYVLPDGKTAYLTDDGTNIGFYMFIADTPNDLSAGQLYAAKWLQLSDENGGRANLEWVALGHANNAEIRAAIDKKPAFTDIFAQVPPENGQCPTGYRQVNSGNYKAHADGGFLECLQLREGMETVASRLETRRYASYLGATTEFNKEEGLTFDPDRKRLYVGMSEIGKGMEDHKKRGKPEEKYDLGGHNHIRLPYNRCGAVYALDLVADAQIGSDYVASNMYQLIGGKMTQAWDKNSAIPAYEGSFSNNACDLNGLGNPDNLSMIPGYDTLIIGEDSTGGHENNFIWSYNFKTEQLTRIFSGSYGSEITSPYVIPDLNGFAYIVAVVQHPFDEPYADKAPDDAATMAITGYIGPFPAFK